MTRRLVVNLYPKPDDGESDADGCGFDGNTPDGTYLLCTRPSGHSGDHWDAFDRFWFRMADEPTKPTEVAS